MCSSGLVRINQHTLHSSSCQIHQVHTTLIKPIKCRYTLCILQCNRAFKFRHCGDSPVLAHQGRCLFRQPLKIGLPELTQQLQSTFNRTGHFLSRACVEWAQIVHQLSYHVVLLDKQRVAKYIWQVISPGGPQKNEVYVWETLTFIVRRWPLVAVVINAAAKVEVRWQVSIERDKVCIRRRLSWTEGSPNFHPGDRCSSPVWNQKSHTWSNICNLTNVSLIFFYFTISFVNPTM